eukprot:9497639-Alexandrium_andersonii.AAC.1
MQEPLEDLASTAWPGSRCTRKRALRSCLLDALRVRCQSAAERHEFGTAACGTGAATWELP